MAKRTPRVTEGSNNVFLDLGFAPEEAEHLRIRSGLMLHVRTIIETRELTQAQAAALFGVSQPRISDLVTGKIHRFSIDGLVEMLSRAGQKVVLSVPQNA
ncbi:MAG: helix-turn-helix domain protein [Gemmatimonadetes bacterium]|nr:helix-turn-helix domain protein [Gemmatimonadota bacterium]